MSKAPVINLYLCGGLGNQLFEYAYARSLALRSGARLQIDTVSFFELDHRYKRTCQLDAFSLPDDVELIRKKPFCSHLRRRMNTLLSRGKSLEEARMVKDPWPRGFYPEHAKWTAQRDLSLLGYWQCEGYFTAYAEQIRKDLSFSASVAPERKQIVAEIRSSESVAIHVRRVDYSPVLDMSYYALAIKEARSTLTSPRFFVFSDDPDWWREHGEMGDDVEIVEDVGLPDTEDFKLMCQCQHYIIANSSFSWWAAWLGSGEDGSVYAPSAGFWSNPNTVPDAWNILSAD